MGLFDVFTQEIAIDLGTANTLIIHNNKIVIDQPSIVAIDRNTGKPIAVGEPAKHMQGKTHEDIKTIRPLKDGVIADFQASEHMIREFTSKPSPFPSRSWKTFWYKTKYGFAPSITGLYWITATALF